jgi:hypothetical protein
MLEAHGVFNSPELVKFLRHMISRYLSWVFPVRAAMDFLKVQAQFFGEVNII